MRVFAFEPAAPCRAFFRASRYIRCVQRNGRSSQYIGGIQFQNTHTQTQSCAARSHCLCLLCVFTVPCLLGRGIASSDPGCKTRSELK